MHSAATQWVRSPRNAPSGTLIFAVGDVHGHADELLAMQSLLRRLGSSTRGKRILIVYLGDYIDRGPAIGRTIDLLESEPAHEAGIERVHLAGNHDQSLIEVLNCDQDIDLPFISMWYENGGEHTMRDLGVDGYGRLPGAGDFSELSARTRLALGQRRVAFIERLILVYRAGDYVFAHAGIDPNKDLDSQEITDLLLIREPFLSASSGWRHPFCVVHGHSISMPSVHAHRIGVDAGCYKYGALCAVQLEEDRLRFLGVAHDSNFPWNERLGNSGQWNWEAFT
jgi:diadenosine tetraphosphatase ApaH/serine/threonine PP2A family protein phosphatase